MRVTQRVKKLLSLYDEDNPGTKTALARILMEGKLGGTGRALILPIDHAFSKAMVPKFTGSDPEYHLQLAVDAGLSALAAPLEMLEVAADGFAGCIPLILQLQVGDPFNNNSKTKAKIAGSIHDALRLGCVGISCVITPDHGDDAEIAALIEEAKSYGLAVMVWASAQDSAGQSEITVEAISKAADTAAALGAHLICIRVPESTPPGAPASSGNVTVPLSDAIRKVRFSCASGKRIMVFAASSMEDDEALFDEIRGIRDGGGQGYVLPPNSLYRAYDPALNILDKAISIYQGKA